MSRYLASFYHLLLSLAIFIGLAYLVVFVWYPSFFYAIEGGWEGMRIIIAVDLVLGPLLTLIVFKAGKPGLKFDLFCIGATQALCLAAGLYVVYSERPTFFIFYEGHFYCASKDTYENYGVQPPNANKFGSEPAMVIATVPDDPIEEADFRVQMFQKRIPIWVYAGSYKLLDKQMKKVVDAGFDYDALQQRDKGGKLAPWLEKYGGTIEDYAFVPVHSRYGSPFIGIRKSDMRFVDVVEVPAPLGGL